MTDHGPMVISVEIRPGDVVVAWLAFQRYLFAPGTLVHERVTRPRYRFEPIAVHAVGREPLIEVH